MISIVVIIYNYAYDSSTTAEILKIFFSNTFFFQIHTALNSKSNVTNRMPFYLSLNFLLKKPLNNITI